MIKLAAVVLSGGEGSRMRGRDKGLLYHQGEQMVVHSLKLADQFADTVVISCNRNQDQYIALGYEILTDHFSGFQGPLAGVQAAMARLQGQGTHLLVLPCDTPNLDAEIIRELAYCASQDPDAICYVRHQGRPQFLHAVLPLSLSDGLLEWMEQGGRAVYKWYQQFRCVEVCAADTDLSFQNINTPADLEGKV